MTTQRGLGRDQVHRAAWTEVYPHPLVSCMMPIVALLGVFAVVLFGLQIWQGTLPRDTIIPPIEGLKVEQASADLQRAGLTVKVLPETRSSEVIPADSVLTADPPGGRRVKRGRVIQLTLSSGSAYTTVPNVRELPKEVAQERLLKAGLQVTKEDYQFDATIPANRVIAVTPKPGMKVKRLSTVALLFSKGSAQSPPMVTGSGSNLRTRAPSP